jgi:Arc/MetJ-type ribon-helix-helix transcriptional regulator
MLEIFRAFFTAYWYVIIPVVFTTLMAIPVIVYWSSFKYWWMNLRIRMPGFGRIRHWVKNPGTKEAPSDENPKALGFLSSESELCHFYEAYYRDHQPSEAAFHRNQDYLGKIHEDGRREKGLGLWSLIIILMLIEATAFGFALAPFALTLATPNTAMAGAFAIGLVISIIGLFLSEFAGRVLYKNSVIDHIMSYQSLRRSGSDGDFTGKGVITLDNTKSDSGLPEYQQMLNRVKVEKKDGMPIKSFGVLIGYGVFIIGLAAAAFWVRTETLNAQETDLIANPPAISQSADDFPSNDGVPLPDDMQALSDSAAGKSAQDQIDALHRASLVTFAVLSGLFIFIQATSTYLAYIYGFAGIHSRRAWELVHKFSSADEYMRYHARKARSVANDAQASLGALQGLQMKVFRIGGDDERKLREDLSSRTFKAFINEEDDKAARKGIKDGEAGTRTQARQLILNYLNQIMTDVNAAIKAGDDAKINQLIAQAMPRLEQIDDNDPELVGLKQSFNSLKIFYVAPAPAAAPAPAPAPVVAQVVAVTVEATPAPVAAPAPAPAPSTTGFDHNAYGDLTAYADDDMDYVAGKKGVDVATIRRARHLQMLDKQEA